MWFTSRDEYLREDLTKSHNILRELFQVREGSSEGVFLKASLGTRN